MEHSPKRTLSDDLLPVEKAEKLCSSPVSSKKTVDCCKSGFSSSNDVNFCSSVNNSVGISFSATESIQNESIPSSNVKKSSLDELTNEIFGSNDYLYSELPFTDTHCTPVLPFSNHLSYTSNHQQQLESVASIKHILAFSPEDLLHTKQIKSRIEFCQEKQLLQLYNTEIYRPSLDATICNEENQKCNLSAKELILSLLPFHFYNREDFSVGPQKYDPKSPSWNTLKNSCESIINKVDSVLHAQRIKQQSPLELQMIEKRLFLEEEKFIFSYLQQEFTKKFGFSYKNMPPPVAAQTSEIQSQSVLKAGRFPSANANSKPLNMAQKHSNAAFEEPVRITDDCL